MVSSVVDGDVIPGLAGSQACALPIILSCFSKMRFKIRGGNLGKTDSCYNYNSLNTKTSLKNKGYMKPKGKKTILQLLQVSEEFKVFT